jgi:hypothetical protein
MPFSIRARQGRHPTQTAVTLPTSTSRPAVRRSEQQTQRAVIEHLAWRARPNVFAFHYPAGGWRTRAEAGILKAIGTVAGIPDIVCIYRGAVFALELKTERGTLTEVQRATHERLRAAGVTVATAFGLDAALAQLEEWDLLRPDVNHAAKIFEELRHSVAGRAARDRRITAKGISR